MEKEPMPGSKLVENSPERKDRFMELMELRHRNAIAMLKVEDILSQEVPSDEYPTTKTSENLRIKKEVQEALGPILGSLSSAGLTKKSEQVTQVVRDYLIDKILAQRVELELKEKLKEKGKEFTHAEVGSELFRQRTGESPTTRVNAIRREGYFVLAFYDDDDYFKFAGTGNDESGGRYHRAMALTNMVTEINVLLSRRGWDEDVVTHERQHFINGLILRNFTDIENLSIALKQKFPKLIEGVNEQKEGIAGGLVGVKDELLARIRDGSESIEATDFFGDNLYGYLSKKFSKDEQKEISTILKKVESELEVAFQFFVNPRERGILVYHLVDIPLLKLPERIRAVVKFYNTKISEFEKLVPSRSFEQQVKDGEKRKDLAALRVLISREEDRVIDLIMGGKDAVGNYEELQIELNEKKDKMRQLRARFDNLLAEGV